MIVSLLSVAILIKPLSWLHWSARFNYSALSAAKVFDHHPKLNSNPPLVRAEAFKNDLLLCLLMFVSMRVQFNVVENQPFEIECIASRILT